MLTILELNIKKIKESNFKLGNLFELHLRKMQDRVSKEQHRVRQEMRGRGIKVLEQYQLEDCITAKYPCRGYTHELSLLWSKVKADTEMRIAEYLGVDISSLNV
ncbi:hypothetical protein ACN92M_10195 [Paenibacillus polymyxa]|uniref:hypothetical protein n=1 Tax=Paenibacillus polymyxa TaxID=1406 RepID=UPI003B5C52F7